jgi:hypothetical protein
MADIKICEYRNCNKELIDKRKHAKFCSITHRACENVYKKREKNKKNIEKN